MIRPLIALAIILAPPVLVGWSLYRAAANGDCEPGSIDDECDYCDGWLDECGICWAAGCPAP